MLFRIAMRPLASPSALLGKSSALAAAGRGEPTGTRETAAESGSPSSRALEPAQGLVGPLRTRLSLKPGRRGTKKLLAKYGERLVCVRYRLDQGTGRRFKTVELVVDDVGAARVGGPQVGNRMVSLRVERCELNVRQAVKRAGGRWNPVGRVWEQTSQGPIDLETPRSIDLQASLGPYI